MQASQVVARIGLSNVQVGQAHSERPRRFGGAVAGFGDGLLGRMGAGLASEIFSVLLAFDRADDVPVPFVPSKSLASISMISSSSLDRARLLLLDDARDGGAGRRSAGSESCADGGVEAPDVSGDAAVRSSTSMRVD